MEDYSERIISLFLKSANVTIASSAGNLKANYERDTYYLLENLGENVPLFSIRSLIECLAQREQSKLVTFN